MKTDIVIVGCGVSGLFAALNLPKDKRITVITKSLAEECDSYLAQGGICVQRDENDFWPFYTDTQQAGHFECDPLSVKTMIGRSQEIINDLISFGVEFEKRDGELSFVESVKLHNNSQKLRITVNTQDEEVLKNLLAYDENGDHIEIEFAEEETEGE